MRVRAFAKINLTLRVLGRRRDGYHDLHTFFQSITLHDTLTIRRISGPLTLSCDDPDCPADRENLVWRAAARVWKSAGRRGTPQGVALALAKRIPMRAGLGGASSDAAAAIRALGKMWRVGGRRQRHIAKALGADIPYFFVGGTALGVGRGDVIVPVPDRPRQWVVLVLPSFGVSTKDAFAWIDADRKRDPKPARKLDSERSRNRDPKRVALQQLSFRVPSSFQARALRNDLEAVVARRHPEIRRIVAELERSGATYAAMSGSGSTVFGLFSRQRAALRAAGALFSPHRRVLVARTLDRRSYQRLAAK